VESLLKRYGASLSDSHPPYPREALHNGSMIPLRISCFPRILYATTTPVPPSARSSSFPSEEPPSGPPHRTRAGAPVYYVSRRRRECTGIPLQPPRIFWVLLELVDDGLGDVGSLGVAWKGVLISIGEMGKGE
jgi:hypothetical protein